MKGSLNEAIEEIRKRYGPTAIMWGTEIPERKTRFGTGSLSVDLALGGGWLAGYMYEIFGRESSLKTTLALRSARNYLRLSEDHIIVYVDVEYALDKSWLAIAGIDPKRFLYVNPDSSESALESVISFLRRGLPVLCIIDSVAALSPELERDEKTAQPALVARQMNQFLRRAIAFMRGHPQATLFLLNQIRMKIGVPAWANPETEPGGEGKKFFAGARLSLRRTKWVSKGEDKKKVGMSVAYEIRKSKISAPAAAGEFQYYFFSDVKLGITARAIDNAAEILTLGQLYGVIEKKGRTYFFCKRSFGSDGAARKFLNTHPKTSRQLQQEIILAKRGVL